MFLQIQAKCSESLHMNNTNHAFFLVALTLPVPRRGKVQEWLRLLSYHLLPVLILYQGNGTTHTFFPPLSETN